MRISHINRFSRELSDDNVSSRNISMFLLNNHGHYLSLGADPSMNITNFNGWFNIMSDNEDSGNSFESPISPDSDGIGYSLYKSIDNLYLSDLDFNISKVSEICNNLSSFVRKSDIGKERFVIREEGLVYYVEPTDVNKNVNKNLYKGVDKDVNKNGKDKDFFINLDLDFRDIYDYDDKGRIYKISMEKISGKVSRKKKDSEIMIVEYTKYSDDTLKKINDKMYLAVLGVDDFILVDKWVKRSYSYDASRNSRAEFYIYSAARFKCNSKKVLIFTFSKDKNQAISAALSLEEKTSISELDKDIIDESLYKKLEKSPKLIESSAYAYVNCLNAIENISMDIGSINSLNPISSFSPKSPYNKDFHGLWAGLPWFFQFWSRDELISLGSLIMEKDYDLVKDILFRHLKSLTKDGRAENIYPASGLASADAVGWLFKRIYDFMTSLDSDNESDDYLTLSDINLIRERLEFSIRKHVSKHMVDGLISNDKLETWMDTFYNDVTYATDYREGFRIEIQALFLSMLKLMNYIDAMLANRFVKKSKKLVREDPESEFMSLEKNFRETVRKNFLLKIRDSGYEHTILKDGFNSSYDDVCRPNIFLAYYLYPELLSSQEWTDAFNYALEELWCEWMLSDGKTGGGLSTIDKKHFLYQPLYSGQNNRSYHRGDSWFWINNIAAISLLRLNKEKYEYYIDKILMASSEDILFNGYIGYASELTSSSRLVAGGCFCQTWSIATFIELFNMLYLK